MRILPAVTVLFALMIVGIISLADAGLGPQLFGFVYSTPGGDKLGHVVLMGTLALLLTLSCNGRAPRLYLGLLLLVVTLEEISQLWFPARSFSLADLASDVVGICGGGMLALYVLRLRLVQRARAHSKAQNVHP